MSEEVSETMRELSPAAEGSYSILSMLKEGSHSRVFLAERAGKRFVLKTPLTDGGMDLEFLRREWEMSIGLSHPGLGYVFTWEESSPVGPCLVQEWVDGRSLSAYLSEGHSLSQRKRVFGQLLSVISYLHRKGVVHNDLSPANILISRADDAVKIIDLGYADDDTHASAKSLGGTRGYASPELLAGRLTDARSDIWTLGALMKDIFPGKYGRIVRRCMQTRPASRYQSVEALEKAWRGYLRPLWIGLAVLLACGLGFLTWSYIKTAIRLNTLSRTSSEREAEFEAMSSKYSAHELQLQEALQQLDSIRMAEMEMETALAQAKAEVDYWYSKAVPEFRKKLAAAKSEDEVLAAWSDLVDRTTEINTDIPSLAPESIRPTIRDYAIQRYNETFPSLQEEMTERLRRLQY